MVFGWFSKDDFIEKRAQDLVSAANIFAITSTASVIERIPLINRSLKRGVFTLGVLDFCLTIAAVGTAFITIADYVPERKGERVANKIGEELVRFHPHGCLVLENLCSLLNKSFAAGIPFHSAIGNWLAINLLKKDQPTKAEIAVFSIAGSIIQKEFQDWFKKK
jgi:hypothetical protein